MKIEKFQFLVPMFLIVIFSLIFGVQAQTSSDALDRMFTNQDYNVTIKYPSSWIATSKGLMDYRELVAIYSPLENISDTSTARLRISVTPYIQNISLSDIGNFTQTFLSQSNQTEIKSRNNTSLAGYPAYQIAFTTKPVSDDIPPFYILLTSTTVGNKVYVLTYEGPEQDFNQYLPVAGQMIQSFRIE
jgi:hypothetical protein